MRWSHPIQRAKNSFCPFLTCRPFAYKQNTKKNRSRKNRYRFSAPASQIFALPLALLFELYIFVDPSSSRCAAITLSSSHFVWWKLTYRVNQATKKRAPEITQREKLDPKSGTCWTGPAWLAVFPHLTPLDSVLGDQIVCAVSSMQSIFSAAIKVY